MAYSEAMQKNNLDSVSPVRTKSGVETGSANKGAQKKTETWGLLWLAILMLTGTLFFKRVFYKKEQNRSLDEPL
jgi:hypothetical protein